MARSIFPFLSFLFLILSVITPGSLSTVDREERKVYIVYMGGLPEREEYSPAAHHESLLQKVVDSKVSKQFLVRSYTKSFNGFAANLTEEEQRNLSAHDEVISIFPSRNLQLLTTESWDFLGLPLNAPRNLETESDVVIGIMDTGIWPESNSFNDHGFTSLPKKWKGACHGGSNFTCNKKIVGARIYHAGSSARDQDGHGTHVASIAAGNIVQNASFYGIAQGIARGGVPAARIAVYKVCPGASCSEHDILASFDDAIADGVDIITVSIGSSYGHKIEIDPIAIGSFHAAQKGVLTVHAAGNNGFDRGGLIGSVAPWLFSVAASTTKRHIVNKIELGNGKELYGYAVNSFDLNGTRFPLVYGADASSGECSNDSTKACQSKCLNREKVKGKIVLCNDMDGIPEVIKNGAIGSISLIDRVYDVSTLMPLPASILSPKDFELVESYYNSTKNPEASIFTSQVKENMTAPVVASFSSRGPNLVLPDILKPDITAPGVNILAAFSPIASPSDYSSDTRSVQFSVKSGTSMACPHVAGAAAYVKSKYPDWSPSVIKSALMTTALLMNDNQSGHADGEYSFGAGFLDPVKALDPGLVYETSKTDYVKLLCSLNLDNSTLGKIFSDNTTCSQGNEWTAKELNYPAISAHVDGYTSFTVKFTRTVTNVGGTNSTYKATISGTPELKITVEPSILYFKEMNEKQTFVVTVSGGSLPSMASSSLEWSDGIHKVRSPIVLDGFNP